jgi:hemoglobin/transferrin/lactoferrin receptor protein
MRIVVGSIVLLAGLARLTAQVDTTLSDSLQKYSAEQVVVSASRWDEQRRSVPRQITTVAARTIREVSQPTTADLLSTTGEVFIQKSQAGGGSPRLRGFAANNVLMVIDGVRLNNAIYRSGNLQNIIQVDANALDRVEVLFGPGSVQYGSDALGGVITFQTHQPSYSAGPLHVQGSGLLRTASATGEKTVSADVELQWSAVASYTAVTYSSFDDVRSGGNFDSQAPTFGHRDWYVARINGRDTQVVNPDPLQQTHSGYDQVNVLERLRIGVTDDWSVNALVMFTTSSDIPRYDRLVEVRTRNGVTTPRSAEWYYGPQVLSLNAVTLTGTNVGTWADDITLTASYQWYEESRHSRNFGSDLLRNQHERVAILSMNADARLRIGEKKFDRDLYYGMEVSRQDISSTANNRDIVSNATSPATTRYPNGGSTYDTYAAYSMLRWGFSESLSMSAGMRFTSIDLQSIIADTALFRLPFSSIELQPSALTGSIGVTWLPLDNITLHANLASGFRAPNIDDAAKVFDSEPGRVVVPNPGLGPVYVTTAEAGIDMQVHEGWTVTTNVYQSWLRDAMEQRAFTLNGRDSIEFNGVFSQVNALQNVGRGSIQGISLSVRGEITPTLVMQASATYTYGRDVTNDVPLEHVVPAFGMAQLRWKPAQEFMISAQLQWSAAWLTSDISPADMPLVNINFPPGGLPAWTIGNVRASYDISNWLTLQASVENIFDLQYRSAGSGISAPGRNIMLALRCRF